MVFKYFLWSDFDNYSGSQNTAFTRKFDCETTDAGRRGNLVGTYSNNVVVVIRSSEERTFEACRELVMKQVPVNAVEIVRECPFEKALMRTYELGIRRGAKWTMTLDADVLLRETAVAGLVAEAEKLPDNYLQIEGLIHDKLTGLYRPAGHRIYRTQHLERCLKEIPHEGTEIRPEYETLQRMERLGFPSKRLGLVSGIHDYEQFYRDIYRKAYVHANKHQVWLAEMVTRWKQLTNEDDDFRFALRGLCDGLMALESPKIDPKVYSDHAATLLRDLQTAEKAKLETTRIDFAFVENVLNNAGAPPPVDVERNTNGARLMSHYAHLGPLRMVAFLAGVALSRTGQLTKRLAYKGLTVTRT
jgi:hypothetical protein